MAAPNLEAAVAQIAGHSAIPVFAHVLDRCRSSRYGWRTRREERLGDVIDTWRALHATAQRASDLLSSRSSHSLTHGKPHHPDLQTASHLSQTFIATLASCLRIGASAPRRMPESVERFLDHLFHQYDLLALLDDMQAMIERLGHLIASMHPSEEWMEAQVLEEPEYEEYAEYEVEEPPLSPSGKVFVGGSSSRGAGPPYPARPLELDYDEPSYTVGQGQAPHIPPPAPIPPSAVPPAASASYDEVPRRVVYMQPQYVPRPPPGHGYGTTAARAVYPQASTVPRGYTYGHVRTTARY